MSTHPRENGPEFFHYAEEFCRKSGPLNSRSIKTSKAAILNGLELVSAAIAALGLAAIIALLYITTASVWISSHSATFNVNVYNRASEQPVSYVLTVANDPEQKRVASGVLDDDESRLQFRDLASGTTYRIRYYTTEDGELKQLDEFLFTTEGEMPSGAPSDNNPSANPPGDSNQNPPAKDPVPKPEDTPPESSSEPAVLPQPSQPPYYPAPGGEEEEEDGGDDKDDSTTPSTTAPETTEPETTKPKPTVDEPILDGAIVETVNPYDPDYEFFNVRYYPSSLHNFILPDGVTLEDIVCYSDDVQVRELPESDEEPRPTHSYYTFNTEENYVSVNVYAGVVSPGESVENRAVLYLSDGSTVESKKTIYTPAFTEGPHMSVTEQIDGDTASYIFQITGSIFCPADSSLELKTYDFKTPFDPNVSTAFSPITLSGDDEVKSFTVTSQTIKSTCIIYPGLVDVNAQVNLYWSICPDTYPLSADCSLSFEPTDIYTISASGDPPVTDSSLPVTDSAVTGPPVRLPDGISNVSANGDGSYSYTETHVFRNLPGDVTSVTIERNGAPSSMGYQTSRSGDTLTVILEPQTLSPGASATGRVSITCSGQAKPLRSTITISADTLQAAAG